MSTAIVGGRTEWSGEIDDEGYRNYTVSFRIEGQRTDGPYTVMSTPGLFLPGAFWALGGEVDVFAFCKRRMTVTPYGQKENYPTRFWGVTQYFSTKPDKRCQDDQIEDPLLQPPKVSGDFSKYTEEGIKDRFGRAITNTSHELFKGPNNEWDANRPKIYIEQNVPLLQLDLVAQMIDCLNDDTLYGFPARWWKLSNCPWEKKYYGQCSVYYTRKIELELKYGGWDRDILDEGTKALHGRWRLSSDGFPTEDLDNASWRVTLLPNGNLPDKNNPADFIRITDAKGDPMTVLLNGNGIPLAIGSGTGDSEEEQYVHVEKYDEADLLQLNIPTTF